MIVRFNVPGTHYEEIFEPYSTQAESIIGLFEVIRTACLDLTADVTVLLETNIADISQLRAMGGGAAAKGEEMQKCMEKAEAFHSGTVSIALEAEKFDSRGASREVKAKALLLPSGSLKRLAAFAIEQARAFQLAVTEEAALSDSAVHLIRTTLDATLSHPLIQTAALTVKPFELLAADISDEELAEALLPVKRSKAKAANTAKAKAAKISEAAAPYS
jgi:hypothetical protein